MEETRSLTINKEFIVNIYMSLKLFCFLPFFNGFADVPHGLYKMIVVESGGISRL